jgi:hypothetical protein
MKKAKGLNPLFQHIGIELDLRNWMPDTGASSHFTPCLLYLQEVEEGLDIGVEVADGYVVKCTARENVEINMIADDGHPLKAHLHGVIYVPGLTRCLFYVTAIAIRGHYAIVRENEIQLMFGQEERPLTLILKNGMPVANNATVKKCTTTTVPEDVKQQSQKKRIDLELAYARVIWPSRFLLAASNAEVWNDLTIRMSPDSDCISCIISTIKATEIKHQSTPVTKLGQVINVEILPTVSAERLNPKSHFLALLILVDAFSRLTRIIEMPNNSSLSVTAALSTFAAEYRSIRGFTLWDIEKIKSDAGTEFTSQKFEQFLAGKRAAVSLLPQSIRGGPFCRKDLAISEEACSMHIGAC